MPNSYGTLTKKELHFNSLEASAELAEKASLIALERGWSYERASEYVAKMNPDLFEMEAKGYVSDKDYRSYEMTSNQAAAILSERAVDRQKKTKEPYVKCFDAECEDDPELAKTYAHGE
jgi:hypothetical protein